MHPRNLLCEVNVCICGVHSHWSCLLRMGGNIFSGVQLIWIIGFQDLDNRGCTILVFQKMYVHVASYQVIYITYQQEYLLLIIYQVISCGLCRISLAKTDHDWPFLNTAGHNHLQGDYRL